jgi:4-hydroxyproline epimerase
MAERRDDVRARFDHLRRAVVCEPRGHDAIVGGLLTPPINPDSEAGIIFFNNGTYLGMCGHGLIGVVRTLEFLGKIEPGIYRFDTPVGTVSADLATDGAVTIENIPAHLHARDVAVDVPGYGRIVGDVAWGGNWFFLTEDHGHQLALSRVDELTDFAWRVREALAADGVTGEGGAEIDHVELFGPPADPRNQSRNFVLCPGKAYDRSPCGTGTSAKLACLHADGKLRPGEIWRQESILGSVFEGSVEVVGDRVLPTIVGRAHITAEATLILDPTDPFCSGIRAAG